MRTMPEETPQQQPRPLDVSKLEILRNRLMLDKSSMARVLGVSRVTYHAWLDGRTIRQSNLDYVRSTLRKVIAVVKDHQWPSTEVKAMTFKQRKHELDTLLQQYD